MFMAPLHSLLPWFCMVGSVGDFRVKTREDGEKCNRISIYNNDYYSLAVEADFSGDTCRVISFFTSNAYCS